MSLGFVPYCILSCILLILITTSVMLPTWICIFFSEGVGAVTPSFVMKRERKTILLIKYFVVVMKSGRDSVEESRLNFLEKFESNIAFSDSQAIRQRNNLEKNKNLISFMVLQRKEDF